MDLTNYVIKFNLKSQNSKQARYFVFIRDRNIEVGLEKNIDVFSDLGNMYLSNLGTSHLTIQITLDSLQMETRKPYKSVIKSRIKLKHSEEQDKNRV